MKKTQQQFEELLASLKAREFAYSAKPKQSIDWTAYSEAKVNELREVIELIRVYVDAVELPAKPVSAGQPSKNANDLAKAVLLQQFMQVSERTAIGWIELLAPRLGISSDFAWRSLARAYEREDVRYVLERVFELTTTPVQGIARSFSADSTGLEETRKENYEADAHSDASAKYLKLTDAISNEFHVVTSYALTRNSSDYKVFQEAFALTAQTQDVQRLSLDAGFLSRDICNAIEEMGATPFVYPKKGVTLNAKGSQAWKKMLLYFTREPSEWLVFYHERSNVESWHSAFKRRFAKPIQCKQDSNKATEACSRIIIENMTQLLVAWHEKRLPTAGPRFRKAA